MTKSTDSDTTAEPTAGSPRTPTDTVRRAAGGRGRPRPPRRRRSASALCVGEKFHAGTGTPAGLLEDAGRHRHDLRGARPSQCPRYRQLSHGGRSDGEPGADCAASPSHRTTFPRRISPTSRRRG